MIASSGARAEDARGSFQLKENSMGIGKQQRMMSRDCGSRTGPKASARCIEILPAKIESLKDTKNLSFEFSFSLVSLIFYLLLL